MVEQKKDIGYQSDFDEVSQFLRLPLFQQFLNARNLSPEILKETIELTNQPPEKLSTRAENLLTAAKQSLTDFYGNSGDIAIPFSGGRDSSTIALLTVDGSFGRKVHLLTALTGFGTPSEKPWKRGQILAHRNGTQVTHHALDISHLTGKYVLDTANADHQQLGYPGICSSCKVVMERSLANAATILEATHLPWGYAQYQGVICIN